MQRIIWIIMLILIVLLGGWALVLQEKHEKNPEGFESTGMSAWSSNELGGINRVRILRKDFNLYFEKDQEGFWWMIEPEKFYADQSIVHRVISACREIQSQRTLALLPEYQKAMDEAGVQVEITNHKDKTFRLMFFFTDSHKHHYFVHVPKTQSVWKVHRENEPRLLMKLKSYRTKRLFPFSLDKAVSFTYTWRGQRVDIGRRNGKWSVTEAQLETFRYLFQAFDNAACQSYVEIPEKLGKAEASYEFVFRTGRRVLCELFLSGANWVVKYAGRKEVQPIEIRVKNEYFPILGGIRAPDSPLK